jgi:hypothetical protein
VGNGSIVCNRDDLGSFLAVNTIFAFTFEDSRGLPWQNEDWRQVSRQGADQNVVRYTSCP